MIDDLPHPQQVALMLGAVAHDFGKPATTAFIDGRIRSPNHEEAGVGPALAFLDRLNVHSLGGYDVRRQVVGLVPHHLKPGQLYDDRKRVSDGAIRRLARKCEPDLLYRVANADCLGRRPGAFEPVAMEWFRDRVRALDVAVRPPEPLLKGRDVIALGVSPGPEVERVLHAVYERQAQWNRRFALNCLDLGMGMVHVSDDWGGQTGLLFSPKTWWMARVSASTQASSMSGMAARCRGRDPPRLHHAHGGGGARQGDRLQRNDLDRPAGGRPAIRLLGDEERDARQPFERDPDHRPGGLSARGKRYDSARHDRAGLRGREQHPARYGGRVWTR